MTNEAKMITVIDEWSHETRNRKYRLVKPDVGPYELETTATYGGDLVWQPTCGYYVQGILCKRIADLSPGAGCGDVAATCSRNCLSAL